MNYIQKLEAIRSQMAQNNISAYIIPSADPHMSEYVPEHYKALYFTCGFSGSTGTVVITADFAGLWTDFRYFEQAEQQLAGSGYELVKLKVQHTPEYIDWLCELLPEDANVGVDFSLLFVQLALSLKQELGYKSINLTNHDLLSQIWSDRPALPDEKAFLLPDEDAGLTAGEKLTQVRAIMLKHKATAHVISSLDDIAWLFNLRGGDILYNTVVLAYALVEATDCRLYIYQYKLTADARQSLLEQGVTLFEYHQIFEHINQLPAGTIVLLDDKRTSYYLYNQLPADCRVITAVNAATLLKAIKNQTEINHTRQVMIKDGVALTRFFKWLEENIGKVPVTELTASEKVKSFREQEEGFAGVSFASIAGYQHHAALPHYCPDSNTNIELQPKGIFLLDSGGHYHWGTTDITRTVSLGENTVEEKSDFTLVLAALISGSSAKFPEGTRGYQIDAICRQPLWNNLVNYGHGTGHGVGFYLNVHEGPQNIGPAAAPHAMETGMITSIEPGIYRPGKHGIRLENLVLTQPYGKGRFGAFLCFETITLCYIDTSLVLTELLSVDQLSWLNHYNQTVYKELRYKLNDDDAKWLENKCKPI